jgi:NADH:ubiquinone oxidoreductase subunit 3 (subunit A)
MDAFSRQVHKKKLEWYEHVNLTVGQMNIIVRVVYVLLALVFVLIVLEAAGIFRL